MAVPVLARGLARPFERVLPRLKRTMQLRSVRAGGVLVVFVAALALWAGSPVDSPGAPIAGGSTSGPPASPAPSRGSGLGTAKAASSAPASPGPASPGRLIDLAGTDDPTGPVLSSLPRAVTRRITLTATGSAAIGAVSYRIQGRAKHTVTNVEKSLTVTDRIGPNQRAAIVVQVSADGGTVGCTIAINGTVRIRHTVTGPYEVTACVL